MKTVFASSTAGIALIASLMGTAHASNESVNAPVSGEVVQAATGANAIGSIGGLDEAAVPGDLLEAFAAAEGNGLTLSTQLPAAHGNDQGGAVTLRSIEPRYGDINPFYGDISPFYGDIGAFWGDINPFYGDIGAFYGDIGAFWGDISPFYGDIGAFWGDIDAFYGDIVAFDADHLKQFGDFWNNHSKQISLIEEQFDAITITNGVVLRDGRPNVMINALVNLVAQGENQFGAAYTAETGQSFDVLANAVFARHGAKSATDKFVIERWTPQQRAAFYLDWHDTLNQYSGIDQIDHWMTAVNWTPAITQIQGNGRDTIIGIIDGSFSKDVDLANNIVWAGGYDNPVGGHGAGVASLIAGAHDGEGVMGIAPDVSIATYNPFNAEGQTSWDHVANGIIAMQLSGLLDANQYGRTSIINLSLGEAGWVASQGLADLFARSDIAKINSDTVYVIAAGNEGVTQNTDIEWNFTNGASTIFVGSVNPLGEISSFSNRPGDSCLLDNGVCHAGNQLYLRTVVAPGELLLVSDGQGGVTRHSGTSFAAPLVSGALALLHDRWPWLAANPEESSEIIFRSARDLGAPGPDEVYGWGLLDVASSQSPLDFNSMTFKMYQQAGTYWTGTNLNASQVLAAGIPDYWETNNAFFTGYENIGDTYRDFSIPVSTFTFGKRTNALGRGFERLQDYINQRFSTWINSGGSDSNGDGLPGFTELRSNAGEIRGQWTLRYDAMAPQFAPNGEVRMVHGAATLTEPSGKASFTFGHGQGAMALSGYRFGIMSDHDPVTGGVNPVLGLASGETFAQVGYKLAENTTVRVGYSDNREDIDDVSPDNTLELLNRSQLGDRPANAMTLDVAQKVSDAVSIGVQLTMLDEENALLGTQTGSEALLGNGSRTEAMTFSASFNLGSGFSVDVSATGARTQTSKEQLFTNAGSVWATAGQFSATKHGVFSDKDTLRVSVAQPLQVEQGALEFTSEQVIDRLTGETGPVTQTIGIETKRRITTEVVYAMPLTRSSEFGVFSRYVSAGDTVDEGGVVVGGNFSLRF
ncbi:S8 family serine peptidase [uncultured Erythrobacter sp.]|uniref:S8 family peptidase n=1 Tax=uncultured Erythrobacter sp. TaxID=263913 RepID=UPI00260AF1D6|nr:S8 family serine peptidase [uncultured Erythrobacter sp.]